MSTEILRLTAQELAGPVFSECASLKELVTQIESDVRAKGRVVCSVAVNGMKLNEADELRLGVTLKQDIDFIEVVLEAPDELMQSTVISQLELMEEIDRVAQAAAEAFRQLDVGRGQELLVSLLDGCRWFTDALVVLRSVLQALKPEMVDLDQWKSAQTKLHSVLSELLAAVEKQDKVLIADILEYELANSLENWRNLLSSLR